MSNVIGVDLGGTKIAIAKYDTSTWKSLRSESIPTRAEFKMESVYADVLRCINEYMDDDTEAVGIGVPGIVDSRSGSIVRLPNIPGSESFPITKRVTADIRVPTIVDNDANCFAYAESVKGVGRGHRVFVGITMGTGVGGGIIIDGKPFRGEHGYGAEMGHILLMPGHPPYDTKDKRGDVEQFLSGTALGKRCSAAKRPEEYLEGEVCSFLRPEVFREVAWMCVNIAHLIDPSMIAFGGSAGRALKPHLPEIRKELSQWMLPGIPLPELAIAELADAATLGTALLAMRK